MKMTERQDGDRSDRVERQDGDGMDRVERQDGDGEGRTLEIGIIGLGLIGGSLAKALKAVNRHIRIVAYDRQAEDLARAAAEHVIDKVALTPEQAFRDCSILFLCTPVTAMRGILTRLLPHLAAHCILVDTGSTKREVMDLFAELRMTDRFVGGHPMAGSERSGYGASRANLFENAWFVLTPAADVSEADYARVEQLVSLSGALPVRMDAASHDSATAHISHLPHAIATLLVTTVARSDSHDGAMRRLAAGGFKDLTRIASASPELWTGICLSNRDPLMHAMSSMRDGMDVFSRMLETRDRDGLLALFEEGRHWRNGLSDVRAPRMPGCFEITVDVEDKPGIIARIATALADREINIKNIGINNVREEDEGALLIRFETAAERDLAAGVLTGCGYGVRTRT